MRIQDAEASARGRAALHAGLVIPACPLALTAERRLDERRQRALCRYYAAAGGGGLAVGVHTTQFAIRDPDVRLLEPVLALCAEELDRADQGSSAVAAAAAAATGPAERPAKVGNFTSSLTVMKLYFREDDSEGVVRDLREGKRQIAHTSR